MKNEYKGFMSLHYSLDINKELTYKASHYDDYVNLAHPDGPRNLHVQDEYAECWWDNIDNYTSVTWDNEHTLAAMLDVDVDEINDMDTVDISYEALQSANDDAFHELSEAWLRYNAKRAGYKLVKI